MPDNTENVRRELVPQMPAELLIRVASGEQVWDTDQFNADYEALGFLSPFVAVRRKADGVKGTLLFTHYPRFYFGWQEDE